MPERQTPVDEKARTVVQDGAEAGSEQPTVAVPALGSDGDPDVTQVMNSADAAVVTSPAPASPAPAAPAGGKRWRKPMIIAGAAVGLLGALYGADLAVASGEMPRGVLVAGVPVGGLSAADAERKLHAEIDPRTVRPVKVTVGDVGAEIDPRSAGLAVDWPATLRRAAAQPLNPFARISSLFEQREVGVVSTADAGALDGALAGLGPAVNRPIAEGSVKFEGIRPVAVDPVPGQVLNTPAAAAALQRGWVAGPPLALPIDVLKPTTTSADVAEVIEKVAKPAVSAPLVVSGEQGVEGTLTPEVIAGLLSFRADQGNLVPELNLQGAKEALQPQLASSEKPGRDAALDFSSGRPVITPSTDGRGVDYDATLKDTLAVLTGSGERKITAVYADQPAKLTTEDVKNLGITGVIGEFTTRGFAPDSGRNIRRAAQVINGKIVGPGETFSLNRATEPRSAANGYVEAGVITDGHPDRGVGGGVSQVATTLYNAAYFAGMVDVEHKPHSFYISRYPAGREATVVDKYVDMKFRNDNPTGVMIQTVWTPASITVRLFGTKRYDVTSATGPRTSPTEPEKVSLPKNDKCKPTNGAPGFTVTDTRTLREISTGQVRRETQTVKYNPSPIVECGDDD